MVDSLTVELLVADSLMADLFLMVDLSVAELSLTVDSLVLLPASSVVDLETVAAVQLADKVHYEH